MNIYAHSMCETELARFKKSYFTAQMLLAIEQPTQKQQLPSLYSGDINPHG